MYSKKIILLFCFFFCFANAKPQVWSTYFGDSLWIQSSSGTNGPATVTNILPVKNKFYISGAFNRIGSDTSFGLTYWQDFHLKPIIPVNWCCQFKDISFHNNKLYVAGDFQHLHGIDSLDFLATWDGSEWDFVFHQQIWGWIGSLTWKNDTLLFCGDFSGFDTTWAKDVALWNGNYYEPMDQGVGEPYDDSRIYCSSVYNNRFVIGGYFNSVAGQYHTAIAEWDGQHWKKMGLGLNGDIYSLWTDTITNLLYAGGWLHINGDTIPQTCFAYWNGQSWQSLADTIDGVANSFCNYRGNLFVGGGFTNIGHVPMKYIAKKVDTGWVSVGDLQYIVTTMSIFNDELIVGGVFNKVNGVHAFGLARYYEPPDSACLYFAPAIYTDQDTFYFNNNVAPVQFYSNSLHGSAWNWDFGDSNTDTARVPLHSYTQPGTYTVSLTLTEAHCTKTVYKNVVIVDTTTAIADLRSTNAELRIYPNPASGSITIEIKTKDKEQKEKVNTSTTLSVTNAKGETMQTYELKEENNRIEINTKGWTKGTYLCDLIVGGKTVKTEKLIIE